MSPPVPLAESPPRARDLGLACGRLDPGPRNTIADVPGVRVGHRTLRDGDLRTGVTAVVPHPGNLYRDKPVAAGHIINGFGKSIGLLQIEELGTIETPILLTNTFGVGTCANALIRRALRDNPDIGRRTATVNPVVCECNDGHLSDIQAMAVTEADALAALDAADEAFALGSVGAGCGMSAFGFKAGIGSASRRLAFAGSAFILGALVLANFGRPGDLRLPDGRRVAPTTPAETEKGSVIVVIATDLPLDHRQLRRVVRRVGVGLARLGSVWGNGSGDIALGFTTANRIDHDERADLITLKVLNENRIDRVFAAVADATEEAVLDAIVAAGAMTGRDGHFRPSLADQLRAAMPAGPGSARA